MVLSMHAFGGGGGGEGDTDLYTITTKMLHAEKLLF